MSDDNKKKEEKIQENISKFGPRSYGTFLSSNANVKRVLESGKFKASNASYKLDDLPKNFYGNDVWRYYLSPIVDQGYCGNCWAVASVAMLSDRFSLMSKNYIKPYLSSTVVTLCDRIIAERPVRDPKSIMEKNIKEHAESSCFGNSITNAVKFLYTFGAVDNKCLNYGYLLEKGINIRLDKNQAVETLPNCQDVVGTNFKQCAADLNVAAKYFRASTFYTLESDEMTIKREIYKFGPIVSGFVVYDNFLNDYDGTTIYMGPGKDNYPTGGHSIRCVGWGEEMVKDKEGKEELVKYWIIANSWGPQWGDGGYFKMKIGVPELEFEKNAMAALPDLPFIDNPYNNDLAVTDTDLIIKRKEFNVDQITGYLKDAIPLIEKGEIYGNLNPIFPKNLAYNLKDFVAGEIQLIPENYVDIRKKAKSYNYIYILIFLGCFILASIIAFFIFKKFR